LGVSGRRGRRRKEVEEVDAPFHPRSKKERSGSFYCERKQRRVSEGRAERR